MVGRRNKIESDWDDPPVEVPTTAAAVLDIYEQRHCGFEGRPLLLREFPLFDGRRGRIDALMVQTRGNRPFNLTALEVKVDRRDFFRELKNPEKRERAKLIADQFYYLVPDGLIDKAEVPEDCGLIGINCEGPPCIYRVAPQLDPPELSWRLLRQVANRSYLKGLNDDSIEQNKENF